MVSFTMWTGFLFLDHHGDTVFSRNSNWRKGEDEGDRASGYMAKATEIVESMLPTFEPKKYQCHAGVNCIGIAHKQIVPWYIKRTTKIR